MAEAGAEVLPEGRSCPGIIRRKKQSQHENEAADAGRAHENAENQRNSNGEFPVSYKKSNRGSVCKHESTKHRRHERVNTAFEKLVNPELETAVKGELRAEHLVLAEDQKEDADTDAKDCERARVYVGGGRGFLHDSGTISRVW